MGVKKHHKGYHTQYFIFIPYFLHDILSSALGYTLQPYQEEMAMQPEVMYVPYATPLKEKLEI